MSFQPQNAFEETFRQFLQEPETQDAIRGDQEKEIKIMKKMDEFDSLNELTGQREQLAVALQTPDADFRRTRYAEAMVTWNFRWSALPFLLRQVQES